MRFFLTASTTAGLIVAAAAAFAQSPAPATPAPTDKMALSKSCSQQADTKGLHGKARKRFRSECKHGH